MKKHAFTRGALVHVGDYNGTLSNGGIRKGALLEIIE